MPYTDKNFLSAAGPILCLDIGSGTQDVLLARPGFAPENWGRFVLPSPAMQVAERLAMLTAQGCGVWLYGDIMGGGIATAVQAHLKAGLPLAASRTAGATLHDDITRVTAMGIRITEHAPQGFVPLHLQDYAPEFWQSLLSSVGLPPPRMVLAAAQDHGVHPAGNRKGRMEYWRQLLQQSPEPEQWLYTTVPAGLTRLCALQQATGGLVADTGMAAIVGALCQPEVRQRSQREGVTIINVGNSHTLAALVYAGKVYGLYEHHTGQRSLEDLLHDLQEFRLGWLPEEKVYATGGHGTAFGRVPEAGAGFVPTFIVGPQREMLHGHGQFIAPHGDMMLTGCYGLLRAYAALLAGSTSEKHDDY